MKNTSAKHGKKMFVYDYIHEDEMKRANIFGNISAHDFGGSLMLSLIMDLPSAAGATRPRAKLARAVGKCVYEYARQSATKVFGNVFARMHLQYTSDVFTCAARLCGTLIAAKVSADIAAQTYFKMTHLRESSYVCKPTFPNINFKVVAQSVIKFLIFYRYFLTKLIYRSEMMIMSKTLQKKL